MTIADRIKRKREELEWSQDELAKRCGYADKTSISKIENSGDDITLKKIKRIADALGVSHHYLMGWEDTSDITSAANATPDVTPDVQKAMRLYEQYESAPPEIRAAIETLLKSH